MTRRCLRATGYGSVLSVACFLASPAHAQEPLIMPATSASSAPASQPASSEPAVAPQSYCVKISNLLVYQVRINSRSATNPNLMEKIDRRELAVFNLDENGDLVLYVGAPKDTRPPGASLTSATPAVQTPAPVPAPAPHSGHREGPRPAAPPPPAEPKPDKPKNIELTWTKYNLGKPLARNSDGTVSIRPDASVVAYPVLPLPPADVKEKDRFDVTVPDIATGAGKTLQLAGQWKASTSSSDRISVEARLEFKPTPGVPIVPEVAIFGYEVARNDPAGVTLIHEARKLPGEAPQPAEHTADAPHSAVAPHPTPAPHAREGHSGGEHRSSPAPHPAVSPRPAGPQGPPLINVLISLAETKPLTDEQHQAMIAVASGVEKGTPGDQQQQTPPSAAQSLIDQAQGGDQSAAKEPKAPTP